MTTINDVKLFELNPFIETEGHLISLENQLSIPFETKRVFYIYNIPTSTLRGKHAHRKTQQILVSLKASSKIVCNDGKSSNEFILDDPCKALMIPKMIWVEEIFDSADTILLVLCDTFYDNRSDYIEDFDLFLKEKGQ